MKHGNDQAKAAKRALPCRAGAALVAVALVATPWSAAVAHGSGLPEPLQGEALCQMSFEGADLVERYLAGDTLTLDELLAIDLDALAATDAPLAAELQGLIDAAQAEPPAAGDPVEPAVPGEGEGSGDAGPEEGITQGPGANAGDDAGASAAGGAAAVPVTPAPIVGAGSAAPGTAADAVQASSPYPAWSYSGSTDFAITHYTADLTTEKFIAVVGEQARQVGQDHGLYASVMIAQAILESSSGMTKLAQAPYCNLLGIQGAYQGQSVVMGAPDGSGTEVAYRAYPSIKACFEDYADLLTVTMADAFEGATKENAGTWREAAEQLQGTYSADESYAESIEQLVEDYDLARFDEALAYELADAYEVRAVDYDRGELVVEERGLADLMAEITSHLGTKYVWGGTTPDGFDCSGLVQYSYRKALGVEVPRTTHYQCLEGQDVDFADLHMGDLLFFADRSGTVVHVGMYLADGCYIESPQPGEEVKVTTLEEKAPTFAKRILATQPKEAIDATEEGTEA